LELPREAQPGNASDEAQPASASNEALPLGTAPGSSARKILLTQVGLTWG
jgi:hypothetical protein